MVNSSMILMLNQYVSPKKQKYLEILIWFLALNFIERVSKIEFLFFFFWVTLSKFGAEHECHFVSCSCALP